MRGGALVAERLGDAERGEELGPGEGAFAAREEDLAEEDARARLGARRGGGAGLLGDLDEGLERRVRVAGSGSFERAADTGVPVRSAGVAGSGEAAGSMRWISSWKCSAASCWPSSSAMASARRAWVRAWSRWPRRKMAWASIPQADASSAGMPASRALSAAWRSRSAARRGSRPLRGRLWPSWICAIEGRSRSGRHGTGHRAGGDPLEAGRDLAGDGVVGAERFRERFEGLAGRVAGLGLAHLGLGQSKIGEVPRNIRMVSGAERNPPDNLECAQDEGLSFTLASLLDEDYPKVHEPRGQRRVLDAEASLTAS